MTIYSKSIFLFRIAAKDTFLVLSGALRTEVPLGTIAVLGNLLKLFVTSGQLKDVILGSVGQPADRAVCCTAPCLSLLPIMLIGDGSCWYAYLFFEMRLWRYLNHCFIRRACIQRFLAAMADVPTYSDSNFFLRTRIMTYFEKERGRSLR